MAYNPAVWYALNARFSDSERARLKELGDEGRHYPAKCPFVDAVKGDAADVDRLFQPAFASLAHAARALRTAVLDVSTYVGEELRFSGVFREPLGPQRVARGEEPCGSFHQQNNGGRRLWASVTGEIEAR